MPDQTSRVAIAIEATARVDEAEAAVNRLANSVETGARMSAAEIRQSTQALALYGRTIDLTSAQAVTAWRESAAAEQALLAETNANTEAMQRLQLVVDGFEKRVASATAVTTTQAVPGMRAAAGAAGMMALSLDGADLSARSVMRSMSTMGFVLGNSVPKLAGVATGVAVLGTELGLLYELYKKMNSEAGKASEIFETQLRLLHPTTGRGDGEAVNGAAFGRLREQIELKRATAEAEIARIRKKSDDSVLGDYALSPNDIKALDRQRQIVNQANEERRQLEAKRDETQRRVTEERTRKREAEADAAAHKAEARTAAQAQKADALAEKLHAEEEDSADRRSADALTRELTRINRAFWAREAEIDRLDAISAAKRGALHQANRTNRAEQAGDATEADARTKAEKAAKVEAEAVKKANEMIARDNAAAETDSAKAESTAAAERIKAFEAYMAERRRIAELHLHDKLKLQDAEEAATRAFNARIAAINGKEDADAAKKQEAAEAKKIALIQRGLDQMVRTHKLSVRGLIAAALEPKVVEMEADAAKHLYKAGAAALSFNPVQAAGELAAAAESLAGAAAIASLGGIGTKGGGGGGGAAGGGSTFQPTSGGGAGGGVNLYLVTKDPTGREQITQTIYQIDQAQVYKQPIYPTSGVSVVGGRG